MRYLLGRVIINVISVPLWLSLEALCWWVERFGPASCDSCGAESPYLGATEAGYLCRKCREDASDA